MTGERHRPPALPSSYSSFPAYNTTPRSVIEENKEKVAKQYDLDGKTALDLALEEDIFSHDNISKDVVFLLFVDLFNEVYGSLRYAHSCSKVSHLF